MFVSIRELYVMIIAVIIFIWLGVVAITAIDCVVCDVHTTLLLLLGFSLSECRSKKHFSIWHKLYCKFICYFVVVVCIFVSYIILCVNGSHLDCVCWFDTVQQKNVVPLRIDLLYLKNYCHNKDDSFSIYCSCLWFGISLFFFSFGCCRANASVFLLLLLLVLALLPYRAIFSAQFLSHYFVVVPSWTSAYFTKHCLYELH